MNRQAGQSTIELVALVPLVLVVALGVVDAAVAVRDRIALADAAGRAAVAQRRGDDAVGAARTGLPASLRPSVKVAAKNDRLVVSVRSASKLMRLTGDDVRLSTSVVLDAGGAQ